MKEILLIAPTDTVYDNSMKVIHKFGFKRVKLVRGILNDGLNKAREFISGGGKIIISRGGTYDVIKSAVTIPVVEIKVSTSDCIAAYNKLDENEEQIGVIGFRNVIYGFVALSSLCGRKFCFNEITDEREIPEVVEKCKSQGITTFVGDVLVEKVIRELNCEGVLVDSQEESIELAIREAERILDASGLQIKMNHKIQTVMDSVRDSVLYADRSGQILLINKSAGKFLHSLGLDTENYNISNIIGKYKQPSEAMYGKIFIVGGTQYIVNIVPVFYGSEDEGTVFSFQPCDEISNLEHSLRRSMSKSGFVAKYTFESIIHRSEKINSVIEVAKRFASVDAPILINGKSGTGKELICQSIHNWSERKNGPFVAINCAAIAPSLIESEFFGYDAGAFTGAKKSGKAGIFELAHKGTLFLDEISELPHPLQGRLLRVLQEKQVMRLGGDKIIPVDVRIICASNRNLKELTETGRFRNDLYYRISILKLNIPPLEERREDILPLAEYFLKLYARKYGVKMLALDEAVEKILLHRRYDGNVRELEGLMEESTVLGSFINLRADNTEEGGELTGFEQGSALDTLEHYSDKYLKKVYELTGKNIKETCRILNISRSTLWRKLNDV